MRQICRKAIQSRLLSRKVLPQIWEVPKSQSSRRRGCSGEVAELQHPSWILWGRVRGRTARSDAPGSYPAQLFSDFKVGVVPVVWPAAKRAAMCGGGSGQHSCPYAGDHRPLGCSQTPQDFLGYAMSRDYSPKSGGYYPCHC